MSTSDIFANLHRRVAAVVSGGGGGGESHDSSENQTALSEALLAQRSEFLAPFRGHRGREAALSLESLYEHCKKSKKNELLRVYVETGGKEFVKRTISNLDELSQRLRLHQHECCDLGEYYLQTNAAAAVPTDSGDFVAQCQVLFYTEQQHQALVLLDLSKQLSDFASLESAKCVHKNGFSSVGGGGDQHSSTSRVDYSRLAANLEENAISRAGAAQHEKGGTTSADEQALLRGHHLSGPQLAAQFFDQLGGSFFTNLVETVRYLLLSLLNEQSESGTERKARVSGDHVKTLLNYLVDTILMERPDGTHLPSGLSIMLNYFSFYKATENDLDLLFGLVPQVVMPHVLTDLSSGSGGGVCPGVTMQDLDVYSREDAAELTFRLVLLVLVMLGEDDFKVGIGEASRIVLSKGLNSKGSDQAYEGSKGSQGGGGGGRAPSALLLQYRSKFAKYGAAPETAPSDPHHLAASRLTFFNEHIILGQFLSFVVNGIYLDEQRAFLSGVSAWNLFEFLTAEVLGSFVSLNYSLDDGRSHVEGGLYFGSQGGADGPGGRNHLPGFDPRTGRPLFGTKYADGGSMQLSSSNGFGLGTSIGAQGLTPGDHMIATSSSFGDQHMHAENFSSLHGSGSVYTRAGLVGAGAKNRYGFPEMVQNERVIALVREVLTRALTPRNWTLIRTYEAQTQRREKEQLQRAFVSESSGRQQPSSHPHGQHQLSSTRGPRGRSTTPKNHARKMAVLQESWMQIAILRCVNRLCRLEPIACEQFAELAIQISESFTMNPLMSMVKDSEIWRQQPEQVVVGVGVGGGGGPGNTNYSNAPHTTVLYAEVLSLFATLISRGPYETTIRLMQRLNSHANQWFNFGYLFELLPQHLEHHLQRLGMPGDGEVGEVHGSAQLQHQDQEQQTDKARVLTMTALTKLIGAAYGDKLACASVFAEMRGGGAAMSTREAIHNLASGVGQVSGGASAVGGADHQTASVVGGQGDGDISGSATGAQSLLLNDGLKYFGDAALVAGGGNQRHFLANAGAQQVVAGTAANTLLKRRPVSIESSVQQCWRHTLVFPTKNLTQTAGGGPQQLFVRQQHLINNPLLQNTSSILPGSAASILSWNQKLGITYRLLYTLKSEVPTLLKAACLGSLAQMTDSEWYASEVLNSVVLLLPQLCNEQQSTPFGQLFHAANRILLKGAGGAPAAGGEPQSSTSSDNMMNIGQDLVHDRDVDVIDPPGSITSDAIHLLTELLNLFLVSVYAVPLRRRFRNLQMLTLIRFVVEKVYLTLCALPPKHFCDEMRYWRLCLLTLKLIKITLRGPLYEHGSHMVAAVAQREVFAEEDFLKTTTCAAGEMSSTVRDNSRSSSTPAGSSSPGRDVPGAPPSSEQGEATCWLFRCFLIRPAGCSMRVLMDMVSLHGRLLEEKSGILYHRDHMKTGCVNTGFDVFRILFQRDHLFLHLHQRQRESRGRKKVVGFTATPTYTTDAGDHLTSTDHLLLEEFAAPWPPEEEDGSAMGRDDSSGSLYENIFVPRTHEKFGDRLRRNYQQLLSQTRSTTGSYHSCSSTTNGNSNSNYLQPNNLTLLLFYVCSTPRLVEISKKAVFVLLQMIARNAESVSRTLNLCELLRTSLSYSLPHNMFELSDAEQIDEKSSSSFFSGDFGKISNSPGELVLQFDFESRQVSDAGFAFQESYSLKTGFGMMSEVERKCDLHDDKAVENLDVLLAKLLRRPEDHSGYRIIGGGGGHGGTSAAVQIGGPGDHLSRNTLSDLYLGREKTVLTGYLASADLNASLFGFESADDELVTQLLEMQFKEEVEKASTVAMGGTNYPYRDGGTIQNFQNLSMMQQQTPNGASFLGQTRGAGGNGHSMMNYNTPAPRREGFSRSLGRANASDSFFGGGGQTLIGTNISGSSTVRVAQRMQTPQHVQASGDLLNLSGVTTENAYNPTAPYNNPNLPPGGLSVADVHLSKIQKVILHMFQNDLATHLFPHMQRNKVPCLNRVPLRELVLLVLQEAVQQVAGSSSGSVMKSVARKSDKDAARLDLVITLFGLVTTETVSVDADLDPGRQFGGQFLTNSSFQGLYTIADNYPDNLDLVSSLYQQLDTEVLTTSSAERLATAAPEFAAPLASTGVYNSGAGGALGQSTASYLRRMQSGGLLSRNSSGLASAARSPRLGSVSAAGSPRLLHASSSAASQHSPRSHVLSGAAMGPAAAVAGGPRARRGQTGPTNSQHQRHNYATAASIADELVDNESELFRTLLSTSSLEKGLPSRTQLRQYADISSVEQNHKEYILVLKLLKCCVNDIPELRDVALRLLSTRFKTRYRNLDSIIDARTESFAYRPAFLGRVLCMEAALLMDLLSCELEHVAAFAAEYRKKMATTTTSAKIGVQLQPMDDSTSILEAEEQEQEQDGTSATAGSSPPGRTLLERQRGEFYQAANQNLSEEVLERLLARDQTRDQPLVASSVRHLLDGLNRLDGKIIEGASSAGTHFHRRNNTTSAVVSCGTTGDDLPLELEQFMKVALDASAASSSMSYYDEPNDCLKARGAVMNTGSSGKVANLSAECGSMGLGTIVSSGGAIPIGTAGVVVAGGFAPGGGAGLLDAHGEPDFSELNASGGSLTSTASKRNRLHDPQAFYHVAGLLLLSPQLQSAATAPTPGYSTTSSSSSSTYPFNAVLSPEPATVAYLDLRARKVAEFLCNQNRSKMARDLSEQLQQSFSRWLNWTLRYATTANSAGGVQLQLAASCQSDGAAVQQLRTALRVLIDAGVAIADGELLQQASQKNLDTAVFQAQLLARSRQELVANFLFLLTRGLLGLGSCVGGGTSNGPSASGLWEIPGRIAGARGGAVKDNNITTAGMNTVVPRSFFHNLAQKLFQFLHMLKLGPAKLSVYSTLLSLLDGEIVDGEINDLPFTLHGTSASSSPNTAYTQAMLLDDACASNNLDQLSVDNAISALRLLKFLIDNKETVLLPSCSLFQQLKQCLACAFSYAATTGDLGYVRAVQDVVTSMVTSHHHIIPPEQTVQHAYESGLVALWLDGATSLILQLQQQDVLLLLLPFAGELCAQAPVFEALHRDAETFFLEVVEKSRLVQEAFQRIASGAGESDLHADHLFRVVLSVTKLASRCVAHACATSIETGTQELHVGSVASSEQMLASSSHPSTPSTTASLPKTGSFRADHGGFDAVADRPIVPVDQLLSRRSLLLSTFGRDLLVAACGAAAKLSSPLAVELGVHLLHIFRDELAGIVAGTRLHRIGDTRSLLQQSAPGTLPSAFSAGGALLGAMRNFFSEKRFSGNSNSRQDSPYGARPIKAGGLHNFSSATATNHLPLPPYGPQTAPYAGGHPHQGDNVAALAGVVSRSPSSLDVPSRLLGLVEANARLLGESRSRTPASAASDAGAGVVQHEHKRIFLNKKFSFLQEELLYTTLLYAAVAGRGPDHVGEMLGGAAGIPVQGLAFFREFVLEDVGEGRGAVF